MRPLSQYVAKAGEHAAAVEQTYRQLQRESDDGERGPRGVQEVQRLGHYQLRSVLGRGGQGTVFLADDERENRTVAVKLLADRSLRDDSARERFRREAEIASRLRHPALCPVLEFGESDDGPFLVMPFRSGWTLAQLLRLGKEGVDQDPGPDDSLPRRDLVERTRDWRWCVETVETVARGLHVAHTQHVVHRDVKPGNILIDERGAPTLMDFGLARDLGGGAQTVTLTGDVLGTLPYMAPEQVAGDRGHVDGRADVYALGVTLFECLTSRLPFDEPTPERMLRAILRQPTPRLVEIRPDLPVELSTVLDVALERSPQRRFRSAAEFADELRRILERRTIRSRPPGPWVRLRRWSHRHPTLAAILVTTFVALSAGLLVSWNLLERVRDQRDQKDAAHREIARLSDLALVRRLAEEWNHLLPPHPERVTRIESWLRRAGAVVDRRPQHQAMLERLRARARPESEEERALDRQWRTLVDQTEAEQLALRLLLEQRDIDPSSLSDSDQEARHARLDAAITDSRATLARLEAQRAEYRQYRFDSDEDQWMHDELVALLAESEAFLDDELQRPTLYSAEVALQRARTLREHSIDRYADEWAQCIDEIADPEWSPEYNGLRIEPQVGLVPLGPDPSTGLQEFAHLLTGEPPERDQEDQLVLDEETSVVLVLLPGGPFLQGAQRPGPGRNVQVDPAATELEAPVTEVVLAPFFLSKYELTQAQWLRMTRENPSKVQADTPIHPTELCSALHPVESISWEVCGTVLLRAGLAIPSVAQWEYGARAETKTPWWTGASVEELKSAGNLRERDDGWIGHAPVGRFAPNPFGLHDTVGNVREWCRDFFAQYAVPPREADGLRLLGRAEYRETRGGSYVTAASAARAAAREATAPRDLQPDLGVRPSRPLDPK